MVQRGIGIKNVLGNAPITRRAADAVILSSCSSRRIRSRAYNCARVTLSTFAGSSCTVAGDAVRSTGRLAFLDQLFQYLSVQNNFPNHTPDRYIPKKATSTKPVIWEIILRDFWGDILRGHQLESRIILLGRLRLDMSSRHTGVERF
jgi:hypothetical protein